MRAHRDLKDRDRSKSVRPHEPRFLAEFLTFPCMPPEGGQQETVARIFQPSEQVEVARALRYV